MARTSAQDCMCVLAIWVVLACSFAERQYFRQDKNSTWNEARSQCQACFKDLVTITTENVQIIAQDLSSDYWVGLRKTLNSTINAPNNSVNSSTYILWSRWANGDPLTFQNWYPGHPVFKSPFPRRDCCNCSCTCSAPASPSSTAATTQLITYNTSVTTPATQFVTGSTGNVSNFTQSTRPVQNTATQNTQTQTQCVITPMPCQDVPDPDENYIEDTCVVMLSFGAWVEKNCLERRPFICYEDRFYGHVNVTDITSTSANLTWDSGPGDITHYRVEVIGLSRSLPNCTNLTYHLDGLTPGTVYSVQVFPLKCGRELNPENATFSTVPNKVSNLKVLNQTENCVSLNWTKPKGDVDVYVININGRTNGSNTTTELNTVCGLTPGSLYNFSVRAAVNNKSKWSEELTVSTYTRPGKVSNLTTSNITNTSLSLSWTPPTGETIGYRVSWFWTSKQNDTKTNTNQTQTSQLSISGLPSGTKITLIVTALANISLSGDTVSVVNYTVPRPIENLTLTAWNDNITAQWDSLDGDIFFKVELYLGDQVVNNKTNVTYKNVTFEDLKTAVNYTITVYSVSGNNESSPVQQSIFTRPSSPKNVRLTKKSTSNLTFSWEPPEKAGPTVNYRVTLNSTFWGQKVTEDLYNKTTHTFINLTSGTNYTFSVQTMAGKNLSDSAELTSFTEADKREITLSMMCSSTQSLLCDQDLTKNSVFNQLNTTFANLLMNSVFWKLEKMEQPDTRK